ncbi:crotonase/enoyl-CoA hydratase family protein [Alloalcanivorax sp.]|jgi:enoyl-CoA hydratase/carnithine racemase|uniref:crotonase/enoyl-CoA hydratase family protein n=1 Tax=Alloalcanivorax sp. TaxID=3020835 RepID=UPI00079468DA|nr:MAG: enoyl-CoA hydratase [Alcanivorax sp. Nap_24]MAQ33973.1 enoyl-CoA hydratase [Alcanivorax sp.]MCH2552625.1 crotonase/enoyl-CoA hydratase family protein [Alcanivorax sp.]HAI90577.1 enoyl-CoA hydratase [Alcanivorax sp.]HBP68687.1 enoyl-CoA hydratase [Alcanivorax sp.]|tara:strand:+ start:1494 stop:2360 length:867 start_codon:yes stop_codon:yes gene_type:complete
MEYQHIRTELADNILTVTLNRPDRMNAFTLRMKDELVHVFGEADRDNQVRAVVVTGAGRAFCAGMEMQPEDGGHVFGYDDAEGEEPPVETIRDSGGEVSLAIFNCRKPVIGALNGAAVGVGITMTLPMDFRLAAEGAKIGFVFTQRGLTPEACSTWFLPRAVGMQKALEWVYSGDIFLAEEGLEAGLFRSLHGKEEVLDAALTLARKLIAKSSPVSVALAKQMLWRNPTFDHPMQAHAVESRMIYRANEFWDGKDGFTAFLEKRDPVFDTDLNHVPAEFNFWPEPPLK